MGVKNLQAVTDFNKYERELVKKFNKQVIGDINEVVNRKLKKASESKPKKPKHKSVGEAKVKKVKKEEDVLSKLPKLPSIEEVKERMKPKKRKGPPPAGVAPSLK